MVNLGAAGACPPREGRDSDELLAVRNPSRVSMKRGTAGLTLAVLELDPTPSSVLNGGSVRYSSIDELENLRGRLSKEEEEVEALGAEAIAMLLRSDSMGGYEGAWLVYMEGRGAGR